MAIQQRKLEIVKALIEHTKIDLEFINTMLTSENKDDKTPLQLDSQKDMEMIRYIAQTAEAHEKILSINNF